MPTLALSFGRAGLSAVEQEPGHYTNGCSDYESLELEARFILARRYFTNRRAKERIAIAGLALAIEAPRSSKRSTLAHFDGENARALGIAPISKIVRVG